MKIELSVLFKPGYFDPPTVPIGFFLNEFQWIQWIMTKSENGVVTRGTQLETDTLPSVVIECAFPLLPLVRYPLWFTTVNKYYPRDSNGNIFFTTMSRNVSVVRYGVSLSTTFGFCLDSLNSANSVKVIQGKLKYVDMRDKFEKYLLVPTECNLCNVILPMLLGCPLLITTHLKRGGGGAESPNFSEISIHSTNGRVLFLRLSSKQEKFHTTLALWRLITV